MWLRDIYYKWRKHRIKNKKRGRWWWEHTEKDVGDENAEFVADFYNRVKGICPYCDMSFDMPGNLRRHILTEHPGEIEEGEETAEHDIARKGEEGEEGD